MTRWTRDHADDYMAKYREQIHLSPKNLPYSSVKKDDPAEYEPGEEDQLESSLAKYVTGWLSERFYPFLYLRPSRKAIGFITKGWCDLIALMPEGIVLIAELKRPKGGRLSPEQKEFRLMAMALGHTVHIISTKKQFRALVYGGGK